MIQSTALLPLSPSLPQGTARQPGGGAAFVLPGGEEPTGDSKLLGDDGGNERQDDAAGGTILPDAAPAIDPWLIAAMTPPVAAPPSPDVGVAAGTGPERRIAAATSAAVAPPVLAVDATGTPATAGQTPTTPSPAAIDPAPPSARSGRTDRPSSDPTDPAANDPDAIVTPKRSPIDVAVAVNPRRSPLPTTSTRTTIGGDAAALSAAATARRRTPIVADAPMPNSTSIDGDANAAPGLPNAERSLRDRQAPVFEPIDTLPGAALATSSLTPLHRREIAAVAGIVQDSAAPAPVVPIASTLSSTIAASPAPPIAVPNTSRVIAEGSGARDVDASDASPFPPSAPASAPATASAAVIALATATTALPLGWRLRTPATSGAATIATPSTASTTPPIAAPTADAGRATAPRTPDRLLVMTGSVLPTSPATPSSDPRLAPNPASAPPVVTPAPPPSAPLAAAAVRDAAPLPLVGAAPASVTPVAVTDAGTAAATTAAAMTRPVPTPQPSPASLAPAAQPAAIVFGAARYAAQPDDRRDEPSMPLATIVASAAPATHPAVAAPVAQSPIDVRHERWPTAMIERIEMIRDAAADAANATDTRIRLVPDALGAIDVDVRRDGDTLHVAFAAEQPQTRALLHDAQPRLAEAAEQRGLKLGQTGVGAEPSGQQSQAQQQPRQQPAPATPRAPSSAVVQAGPTDADDARLA